MYKDIDEAIKSERIKAEYLKEQINSPEPCIKASKCLEMAEEHEQLAKWLEELKELRELKDTYKKGMETSYSEFRYQQGRQDERKEWECAVADKIIKHDEDIYTGFPEVIKQIRNDTLDEAIAYFEIHAHEVHSHISARDFICDRLEQLKESKE